MNKTNRKTSASKTMMVIPALVLISGFAVAEVPASLVTLLASDNSRYLSYDPGVPAWKSTCNCIRVAFGEGQASGRNQVELSVGNSTAYSDGQAVAMLDRRGNEIFSKSPLKQPAERLSMQVINAPTDSVSFSAGQTVLQLNSSVIGDSFAGDWVYPESWAEWGADAGTARSPKLSERLTVELATGNEITLANAID